MARRRHFDNDTLSMLAHTWLERGPAAIALVRELDPARYIQAIAAVASVTGDDDGDGDWNL
jgi:hypothetical protein